MSFQIRNLEKLLPQVAQKISNLEIRLDQIEIKLQKSGQHQSQVENGLYKLRQSPYPNNNNSSENQPKSENQL